MNDMSGNYTPATPPAKPSFSMSNIVQAPGSSLAGLAAILSVVASALGTTGWPTTTAGWISFGITVATGVGAILSRA